MADNFLERHRLEYEKRKEEWLRKKKHLSYKNKHFVNNHLNKNN